MTLIADALDLVHRLPHTWRRAQTLEVPLWRARRVAQKTHALTVKAAAHVDRAARPAAAHRRGHPHRPHRRPGHRQAHARGTRHREERSKQTWDVTLHHPNPTEYAGTSELHIIGDTITLTHLHDRICATAAHLKTDGDQAPLGVRKARALGNLAGTPTTKLYLHLDADGRPVRPGREARPRHRSPRSATGSGTPGSPSNPSSGPTGPSGRRPRPTRLDARPGHPPRPPLRVPALPTRRPGLRPRPHRSPSTTPAHPAKPAQQPRPAVPRHHRAKTTGRWQYRRLPDGTYQWTGPGAPGAP